MTSGASHEHLQTLGQQLALLGRQHDNPLAAQLSGIIIDEAAYLAGWADMQDPAVTDQVQRALNAAVTAFYALDRTFLADLLTAETVQQVLEAPWRHRAGSQKFNNPSKESSMEKDERYYATLAQTARHLADHVPARTGYVKELIQRCPELHARMEEAQLGTPMDPTALPEAIGVAETRIDNLQSQIEALQRELGETGLELQLLKAGLRSLRG